MVFIETKNGDLVNTKFINRIYMMKEDCLSQYSIFYDENEEPGLGILIFSGTKEEAERKMEWLKKNLGVR